MNLDLRLIAAYLINLIVLFIFLRWILYKPVKKFLDEREARYARRVEYVEQRDREVEEDKARYKSMMDKMQADSETILKDTRAQANRRAEEILQDAEQQAGELAIRARKEIEEERLVAQQNMREEIVNLAVDMASRVLEREAAPADHERMVQKFLATERIR
jgi:F-type H+-transporting ATPase subunit b